MTGGKGCGTAESSLVFELMKLLAADVVAIAEQVEGGFESHSDAHAGLDDCLEDL